MCQVHAKHSTREIGPYPTVYTTASHNFISRTIHLAMRRNTRSRQSPPAEVVITLVQSGPLTEEEMSRPPPYQLDTTMCRFLSLRAMPEAAGTHALLWEGGTLLARFLSESYEELRFHSSSFLELGAGLGACGLKAAAMGAKRVVLTDLPEAVPWIEYNARTNLTAAELARVSTIAYSWGGDSSALRAELPFDWLLCGDLVYHAELVRPLLAALDELATPGRTTVLLAVRSRPGKLAQQEAVLTGLERCGFTLSRVPLPCAQRGTYMIRAVRHRPLRPSRLTVQLISMHGAMCCCHPRSWLCGTRQPRDLGDGDESLDVPALLKEVGSAT